VSELLISTTTGPEPGAFRAAELGSGNEALGSELEASGARQELKLQSRLKRAGLVFFVVSPDKVVVRFGGVNDSQPVKVVSWAGIAEDADLVDVGKLGEDLELGRVATCAVALEFLFVCELH